MAAELSVDGKYSFEVSYEGTRVTLTGFQPEPPAPKLLNLSTRARVRSTAEDASGYGNAVAAGFIISGDDPVSVVIRGIGPSLARSGVSDTLANPVLELFSSDGAVLLSNDNWRDTQSAALQSSGLAPSDPNEAAMITTLTPGAYTARLGDKNGGGGNALVEIYDVSPAAHAKLANISTLGLVDAGNVLISGLMIEPNGEGGSDVVVRALGPQLRQSGIIDALDDPTLEVRDANGATVASNDDHDTQAGETLPVPFALRPSFSTEAALRLSLPRGNYTALVAGKNGMQGTALVEFYDLRP